MNKSIYLTLFPLLLLAACATNGESANPVDIIPPKPKIEVIAPQPVPPASTEPKIIAPPVAKIATGEIIFGLSSFDNLPNWSQTDINAARRALLASCQKIIYKSNNDYLSQKAQYAGKYSNWLEVCEKAKDTNLSDADFWQNNFNVWDVRTENSGNGRLTSYFEPVIDGNFVPDTINNEPIFAKPNDLLTIELGDFDPSLRAKTIVGRIHNNDFVPYFKRSEITPRNAKPLFYTNMGDAVSLQIQGSGRINLPDGKQYRAVYAATNGQPFFSPAQELIRRGIFELSQASAGNVKKWFETAEPKLARDVINANPRTVFYELKEVINPNIGPNGSQGVPLVAGGSMAIDPSYHAYGVPIFVSAFSGRIKDTQSISRLVIAQDTGGAIKGPIRGDLFWGTGVEAGLMAGKINHDANFWVFLPKSVDPTIYNPKIKAAAVH